MNSRKLSIICVIVVTLLLVASALTVACAPAAPAKANTLKIGAVYSLTGEGSEAENAIKNGAVLAADWINEKGGISIKGAKYLIEMVVEDQKGNPDGTVAAANKLVTQDNVKFIVGPCNPLHCIAEASITETAKVIRSISFGAGVPDVMNAKTPYTFRSVLSGAELIPVTYTYLSKVYPNVKKVATMAMDEPGGKLFASVAEKEAAKYGIQMVGKEFYPWGTADFYPLLTKILANKPDAVDAGVSYGATGATQLKQLRELGFTGPVFSAGPSDLYYILDKVGKDSAYDYFNTSMDLKSADLPPMMKEIGKRWAAKFREPFIQSVHQGWDSLWTLAQAIEKAQSLDTTEVAAAWEKMQSIETSLGTGSIGGLKTYGVNHLVVRQCPISRLEKGKVEAVGWLTPQFP